MNNAGNPIRNGGARLMKKHNHLYTLFKLPLKELISQNYEVSLSMQLAVEMDYLVKQSNSLFFHQVERLRGYQTGHIAEVILIIAKKNPRQEEALRFVMEYGFSCNGIHYSRFGKSASQGKAGITAFVCDSMFEELYTISQLDIPINQCIISKYEAQRGLIFSSCTPIEDYLPNIVIIGEYQNILPHQLIKYVVEQERTFTDPETGEIKSYPAREIREGYRDIPLSPFDGCGCHELDFTRQVQAAMGLEYEPAGCQIRMPFMKGYTVYVPFRQILKEWGVDSINDIYGVSHSVETIDCIWNISMFKGHKLFLETYGKEAWKEYGKTLLKYHFPLGISKCSHHIKALSKKARMNFQYLQCLDLWNPVYVKRFVTKEMKNYDILAPENEGKIISAAKYTTALFERIIKGDPFYSYKFLGITDTDGYEPESRYLEAVLMNETMLRDPAIRQYLYRKLLKFINEAKVGKIYADGFYHTVVSDMIGYLQYACGLEPVGCLQAHEAYCPSMSSGACLSFRSPLVCPSEVNELILTDSPAAGRWFSHFAAQDLVMMNLHDLSAPQQGGMDFDGDIVFLCNDPVIVPAKIAKPIIIDMEDKATALSKPYTKEHIIDYEILTRDNRIGEITNAATSIENKYTDNPEIKRLYADLASLLRVFQGKEIDFLKTGLRWHLNSGLRKHLKQLPYFLLYNYPDKMKTYKSLKEKGLVPNAYHSPAPMNELCDYICAWEKKQILWNRDAADTGPLLVNPDIDTSDLRLRRLVRRCINNYAADIKAHMALEQHFNRDALIGEYKARLAQELQLTEIQIANYVIDVSYKNRSISKSLAWAAYGDYLIENLKLHSEPQKRLIIKEVSEPNGDCYEYLGKYYEMVKGEDYDLPTRTSLSL